MFGLRDEKTSSSQNQSQVHHENEVSLETVLDQHLPAESHGDELLHAACPPHTTERALVLRMDQHILPYLVILCLLAFLDRVNIANAASFHLNEDLNIDPQSLQYNTALTIFFIPYVLFEIPSNILLKQIPPRIWLSTCVFLFGLATTCQGLVQSYTGLLITRFLLGLFEAGIFPGCFYIIGMWYQRSEAQRRYSFFFSSTTLAGAFGGLLAPAIATMDGLQNFHGWRWIFILEGLMTCTIAVIISFFIPPFPEDATWLQPSERTYIRARLQLEQGRSAVHRTITMRDIRRVFTDYKIFLGGIMYFGLIVPAYGYAYFAPSILASYHYSPIQTQLFSVPPWACAFVAAMLIAFASDRFRHRFLFALLPMAIAIIGFAILISVHDHLRLQYFALFLVAMGTFSAMPVVVCWFNMNLGGHHRRSVGSAYQIGFGNIGGIISTYAFLKSDAVNLYHMGHSICLAFIALSALACCIYAWAITTQNRQRDLLDPRHVHLSEDEKTELGDLSPDYRYLL